MSSSTVVRVAAARERPSSKNPYKLIGAERKALPNSGSG
jgi:hypothetical protein